MDGYRPEMYGDSRRDVYDRWAEGRLPAADAELAVLHSLAGSGPVLELGVGTGRVALPIANSGIEVWGIDTSSALLDQLHAKAGREGAVRTIHGDMASFDLGMRFSLVYCVFSTFLMLATEDAQASCMRCVARHLAPGGAFLLEASRPRPERFQDGSMLRVSSVSLDEVVLTAARYDGQTRRLDYQNIRISNSGTSLHPGVSLLSDVDQLDCFAAGANLRLAERWGGWEKEQFSPTSPAHVSVYCPR